jgi:hypothetical protein
VIISAAGLAFTRGPAWGQETPPMRKRGELRHLPQRALYGLREVKSFSRRSPASHTSLPTVISPLAAIRQVMARRPRPPASRRGHGAMPLYWPLERPFVLCSACRRGRVPDCAWRPGPLSCRGSNPATAKVGCYGDSRQARRQVGYRTQSQHGGCCRRNRWVFAGAGGDVIVEPRILDRRWLGWSVWFRHVLRHEGRSRLRPGLAKRNEV